MCELIGIHSKKRIRLPEPERETGGDSGVDEMNPAVFLYCMMTFMIFSYAVFQKGFSPIYFGLMVFLDMLFMAYMKTIKN